MSSILKPVIGPGTCPFTGELKENADELPPKRRGHGPGNRFFQQMLKACPELKNNYCRHCNSPLVAGKCPRGHL